LSRIIMKTRTNREGQIFETARKLKDPGERCAHLDALCAGDALLRSAVEGLLAAEVRGEFFFADGASALKETVVALAGAEQAGDRIGRYQLLQQIGEGGCGVVYMAEQEEPVRRRVALKIIKLGMDSKGVVARFEAERQALAMMDHANIARILDAGATGSGRPYFVMELVRGVKITDFCDEQRLPTRERLGLFVAVCEAVQHAHQKGIIHRDLKPSNILVTINDGVATPKVIDFGIAKAMQGRLTNQTLFTAFEQLLGTPAYMSPEQALMTSVDIDTRSDLYSLGVLLYELLTGTTPFDTEALMAAGVDQMRHTICQRVPLRPSTRLRSMPEDLLTSAALRRRVEVPKLLHGVSGDLDWVVMKCLEKERARRYSTANGLAMDIHRHLNSEPVVARPPSTAYRFRKLVQRNKAAFAAAAALLSVLCLGLVGTALGLLRARAEAQRARSAENTATQDRDRANMARQETDKARLEERRLNFHMAFDRGIALCDQGDVGRGMLWLARALEWVPPDEPDLERVIRANLAAWQRELHTLYGIYPNQHGMVTGSFSPDETLVLTGALDGAVQLWDRETGLALGALPRHDAEVHTAVFSPDGTHFLTTSVDKTARLWETKSPRLLREFRHSSAVWGGVFTPDGRIITSNSDGEIQVWDRNSANPIDSWRHTAHGIHDLDLSPDGKQVLGACDTGVVQLWDLETHRVIAQFVGHTGRVPTAVFVAPNRIASGDVDGNVFLWTWAQAETTVSGEKVGKPWRHRGGVHRLRASMDRGHLLTASYDTTAQLLNSRTGEPVGVPFEHQGALKSVAFGKNGRVLTFCENDAAREWRPAPGSLVASFPHDAGAQHAIFSADAQYVLIRAEDETAMVRRAFNGEPVGVPFEPHGGIHGFAISPDESKVMTGAANGTVQFWETATGLAWGEPFQHSGGAWAVAISRDGKHAVSGGLDGLVKLWDAKLARPLHTLLALRNTPVRGAAFSPDGSRIAIASSDKLAWIVETDGRELPRKLAGHLGSVMTVAFSADGQQLVTGSFDNTLLIWSTQTGLPKSKPMRHRGPFWYAVAFSEDGKTVVAGCDDYTARVWDVATARPVGPSLLHNAALRTAAFTEGDSRIITGTSIGTTCLWDVLRTPLQAEVERITLWLQVRTGMELGTDGELRPLDPESWRQRRQRLGDFGGTAIE
jgi:eukaryotic-like serine/threonine-protein kinase